MFVESCCRHSVVDFLSLLLLFVADIAAVVIAPFVGVGYCCFFALLSFRGKAINPWFMVLVLAIAAASVCT